MSIIQELKERRAIRNYEEKEVEDEKSGSYWKRLPMPLTTDWREPWSFYVDQGGSEAPL